MTFFRHRKAILRKMFWSDINQEITHDIFLRAEDYVIVGVFVFDY